MQRAPLVPLLAARLAHDPRLAARLAWSYDRLRALPRRRRRLMRRLRLSLAAAALLLALAPGPTGLATSVRASTVTGMVVADGAVEALDNYVCSLIEAIDNANDTITGQPYDCLLYTSRCV